MSTLGVRSLPAQRTGTRVAPILLAALGVGALLMRTRLLTTSAPARTGTLAALYAVMLAVCVAVSMPRGRRHLPRSSVLLVGLAAVGLAALAAGRPAPIAYAAWALPLAVLAAVAEEALFRRVLYGALAPQGATAAIGLTALVFALIHVPLYGVAAFPVDLGAGLLFGWQRWASGTWTVPAGTHAVANVLAVILR
jgi:membrane protease YdiL (CAAX protease family)